MKRKIKCHNDHGDPPPCTACEGREKARCLLKYVFLHGDGNWKWKDNSGTEHSGYKEACLANDIINIDPPESARKQIQFFQQYVLEHHDLSDSDSD
jgi:hypothetical protein